MWSARYRLVIGFAAYDKGKVRRRRREAHRRRGVYMLEWSCECRGRESKVKGLSAATSVADMVIACLDKDRNCCLDRYRKHCAYLASLKPLYVFIACCECGSRVAEPQVPCHSRIHSSEVEGWGTTGVGPQRTNRPWSEGSSRAVQSKL